MMYLVGEVRNIQSREINTKDKGVITLHSVKIETERGDFVLGISKDLEPQLKEIENLKGKRCQMEFGFRANARNDKAYLNFYLNSMPKPVSGA